MNADVSNIGPKIKDLREKANLTQKQVADYLSVDQSLISKFEKGERSIHSDGLNQLAELFCCPVSAFLSSDPVTPAYTIAFRTTAMDSEDLRAIAVINRLALNQFRMDRLAEGGSDDR